VDISGRKTSVRHLRGILVVIAVISAAIIGGCSREAGTVQEEAPVALVAIEGEHPRDTAEVSGEESGEHAGERSGERERSGEHGGEGSGERREGSGEHAGEGSGEHGGEGQHAEEGEESGTEYGLNDKCDEVRNGARLILTFDAESNSFVGTVENTTEEVLKRVRVEVHLSNGVELGPTNTADLAPGEKGTVKLTAISTNFDKWSAHPEVGGGEGG
jgi:hypothetical protein